MGPKCWIGPSLTLILYIYIKKKEILIYIFNLFFRAPSASRIREKMLYATSKDGLRRALEGIHYEVQATDLTEMGFDVIKDRVK